MNNMVYRRSAAYCHVPGGKDDFEGFWMAEWSKAEIVTITASALVFALLGVVFWAMPPGEVEDLYGQSIMLWASSIPLVTITLSKAWSLEKLRAPLRFTIYSALWLAGLAMIVTVCSVTSGVSAF